MPLTGQHAKILALPRLGTRRRTDTIARLLRLASRFRVTAQHANSNATVRQMPTRKISEFELHAYVDDALDNAERLRVEAFLAGHPAARVEVEAYRQQTQRLRRLFAEPPAPLPPELDRQVVRLARTLTWQDWFRRACWIALIGGALLLGGWLAGDWLRNVVLPMLIEHGP